MIFVRMRAPGRCKPALTARNSSPSRVVTSRGEPRTGPDGYRAGGLRAAGGTVPRCDPEPTETGDAAKERGPGLSSLAGSVTARWDTLNDEAPGWQSPQRPADSVCLLLALCASIRGRSSLSNQRLPLALDAHRVRLAGIALVWQPPTARGGSVPIENEPPSRHDRASADVLAAPNRRGQ